MGNTVFPYEAIKTLLLTNKYVTSHCCSTKRTPKDNLAMVELQELKPLMWFNFI